MLEYKKRDFYVILLLRRNLMLKRILALALLLLLCSHALAEGEPDPNARFRGIPTLETQDGTYRLNRRLTTVLLMGIDKSTQQIQDAGYRGGGQADFLALLVVDDAQKRISMIEINRDTMTELTVLNVLGQVSGKRTGQICLSHGFGSGGEDSCKMTAEAVSTLLNKTPVNYYIALNMDGITVLNDALGGVEVTLAEDFSAFDPAMTAGATLTLRGMQAEYYVRGRFGIGDQSNLSRLERQRTYMNAAASVLRRRAGEGRSFIENLHSRLEDYLVSNLSRGALYNLGEKAGRYEIMPIYRIQGEASLGESGFMEFYPDETALKQLLIDVLYEKVS